MSMALLNKIDELKDALIGCDIDVDRLTKQRNELLAEMSNLIDDNESLRRQLESAQDALRETIADCRYAYDKGRADQAADDLEAALEQAEQLSEAQKERDELAMIVVTDTGTESAVSDLQNQLDNHLKREVMLRGALEEFLRNPGGDYTEEIAEEALDATADLEGDHSYGNWHEALKREEQDEAQSMRYLIEAQAAQIEMLHAKLTYADLILEKDYNHIVPSIKRALSTTPNEALQAFAEKVRDQAAQVIESQDVDPSFKHRMADAIRSITELPK